MNVIEVFNDSYERCVLSEHFFRAVLCQVLVERKELSAEI